MTYENYSKSLMYVAIMNNSIVDSRCMAELTEGGLIGDYKDLFDIIKNDPEAIGVSESTKFKLIEAHTHLDEITARYIVYEQLMKDNGIVIVNDESDYYPTIWKGINCMPKVLFLKGDPAALKRVDSAGSVSVVGSRMPGRYAEYATRDFVTRLAKSGVVIVSGMALGIDRTAHYAALEAGATTLAVLPGGCEEVYPRQNLAIYNGIVNGGGAVISELPPASGVKKQYFPSRNRLISALSDACLIMEAGEYSGTLHTASFAAAQGRDVFVLPNNIYADNCMGGLRLIGDGASVLLDVKDVIDSVTERLLARKVNTSLTNAAKDLDVRLAEIRRKIDKLPEEVTDMDVEELISDELQVRNLTVDDLCTRTKLPFYRISQILSDMEIRHRVYKEKGKYSLTMSH